jgi:hypothetical protein
VDGAVEAAGFRAVILAHGRAAFHAEITQNCSAYSDGEIDR